MTSSYKGLQLQMRTAVGPHLRLRSVVLHSQTRPLLIPLHRQVLPQLFQAQTVGFVAVQDRLDDVRREAGQTQHAADVGAVAARLRLLASPR